VNHFVTGRLVKYTYGAIGCITFDASDPEHRQRSGKKQLSATGEFVLEMFAPILWKVSGSTSSSPELTSGIFQGTKVVETEEFSDMFLGTSPLPPTVAPKKLAVVRYKGELEKPQWVDIEPGQCDAPAITTRLLTHGDFEQTTTRPCAISWWMGRKSPASVSFLR